MAAYLVCLLLLFAMAGHSDATYCLCNSGLSDTVLQRNIDYACGNGADCSAILQNGPCFNPNTVRDHCNYAVNSYYQRKNQMQGSCEFQGTATVSQTAPTASGGCVYQSSPSGGGSTVPTAGGTPTTGGTTTTTVPGTTGVGLAPTASGFGTTDNSASVTLLPSQSSIFVMLVVSLSLISSLI